ncbi:MAG TPA: uracil phosphoribosyltransferase [Polyangiales bacterium]|nr:uracil phosphoribosyltransferase [Polyangiales bacterium]
MPESAYQGYTYRLPELAHGYGANVHLLADPILLSQLARLCRPEVVQPEITTLVRDMYHSLVRMVIANEFPRERVHVKTRMYEQTERAVWSGDVLDSNTRAITVNIARAGTMPSQVAFETLIHLTNPAKVRQDHVFMARTTDDAGCVTGVSMSGSKIGGDVEGAVVLLPDPMGATGVSLSRTVSLYKELPGRPRRIASLHLIITPEFVRRMQTDHPDVVIYAIRLDRGMSSEAALRGPLGQQDESGLNEIQYIVPGAGGVGELLNNSFV